MIKRQRPNGESGEQKRQRFAALNPDELRAVPVFQPTLVDVLAHVQDYHISRYLESPEVFNLVCVARHVLKDSEIKVTCDPYFTKLVRGPTVPNPRTITLQEARR